jgi:hypothetical protein
MSKGIKLAYIGNFTPPHSTENHVRQAWEDRGHTVIRVQEGDDTAFNDLMVNMSKVDLVLWTRTADLAAKWGHLKQLNLLARADELGVPTVGFHLDRWWGLDREAAVWQEPFFRCKYVITADGGHDPEFRSVLVNHVWLPPAVSLFETEPAEPAPLYRSPLAFVGSWRPGYHKEWKHRPQLVSWLERNYRNQIKFWPQPNQPSIRGEELRSLYASVDVVIGDSCLVGDATHYWSDRIPETVGRGGFLLHPYVKGLEDHFDLDVHLKTWNVGDWDRLHELIEHFIRPDRAVERRAIAEAGRAHVRKHHTYHRRTEQIQELIGL